MSELVEDPKDLGLCPDRLSRIPTAIKEDIEKDQYDGAAIIISRNGKIVLDETIGFSHRPTKREVKRSDIFCLFSISKSYTGAIVLDRVERGKFLLTTPVADIIPEFSANGKAGISVYHLLTHTAGMPTGRPNLPSDLQGNLEACVEYICKLPPQRPIGEASYSAVCAHYILAELVRRVEGSNRPFWKIMDEDLFEPLKMHGTSLGQRPGTEDRVVPVVAKEFSTGFLNKAFAESVNTELVNHGEIPAGGVYGTASDVWRFAEMLRRGGELDGARILSPAMIRLATTSHSGDRPFKDFAYAKYTRHWEDFRVNSGMGFVMRGDVHVQHSQHGNLASPQTFGHKGAGTTNFWVDPVTGVSFVCLTAGFMEETYSWDRWQRISDMVHASIVA